MNNNQQQIKKFSLPDLCRNSAILMAIIMSQVVTVLVYFVLNAELPFVYLCLLALFMLWVFLGSSAILCFSSPWLKQQSLPVGFIISFLLCISVFTVIETISYKLVLPYVEIEWQWEQIAQHYIIASILIIMALRFFLLLNMLEERSQSEIKARIQSLQSRIQPHFLFNSLNTIAELVATRPEQAEKAIQSLSSLFRSSLSDAKQTHSMQAEVDLCEQYLELEKWRLQDRLRVKWNTDAKDLSKILVPRLVLQPLVENAVLHGVQNNEHGGDIEIKISEKRSFLEIEVNNTHNEENNNKKGSGIALENLGERLNAIYDDQYRLKISNSNNMFEVKMRLPRQISNMGS